MIEIVTCLEHSGVPYAVLREGIRAQIVIDEQDVRRLPGILAPLGLLLWEETRPGVLLTVFNASSHEDKIKLLGIEWISRVTGRSGVLLNSEDLLTGRERIHQWWRAASAPALAIRLADAACSGAVSAGESHALRQLYLNDPTEARRLIMKLSPRYGELLSHTVFEECWEQVDFQPLQAEFQARSLSVVTRVRRLLQPQGIAVAFLGPDGSGKTTLLEAVEDALGPAFRAVQTHYVRPALIPRRERASNGQYKNPHGRKQCGPLKASVRLLGIYLDWLVGWAGRIHPALANSEFVLFDRNFDDLLVDPKRYRMTTILPVVRFLARFVPRPAAVFCLDIPPEVAYKRKPELSLDELERQREALRRFAARNAHVYSIDANRKKEAVAREVIQIITRVLNDRAVRRTGAKMTGAGRWPRGQTLP